MEDYKMWQEVWYSLNEDEKGFYFTRKKAVVVKILEPGSFMIRLEDTSTSRFRLARWDQLKPVIPGEEERK